VHVEEGRRRKVRVGGAHEIAHAEHNGMAQHFAIARAVSREPILSLNTDVPLSL
jgi:hypothetical protein